VGAPAAVDSVELTFRRIAFTRPHLSRQPNDDQKTNWGCVSNARNKAASMGFLDF
jgi:hypothetical protein